MSETIIVIWKNNLQAWEYGGAAGKQKTSLLASSQVDTDLFSREGLAQLEKFLKSLNGGETKKVPGKSRVSAFLSGLDIPRLDFFRKALNGSDEKKPAARLILAGIDLFIRQVELPFGDVKKARLAAPSVIASTLPFEGGFLLDLIPLKSGEDGGRFLAVCAREQEIDTLENAFLNAGLSLEQVIPGFLLLLPAVERMNDARGEGVYIDEKIAVKAGMDWQESGRVRILPLNMIEEEGIDSGDDVPAVINMAGKNDSHSGMTIRESEEGLSGDMVGEYFRHSFLGDFNLIGAKITEFKDATEKKTKKYLLIASIVLIVLSLIVSLEGTKHFTRKKAAAVKSSMTRKFSQIIKGAAMVDPVSQIREKISSMEEELALFPEQETPFYSLLLAISSDLSPEDRILIREINYTKGKFTITGEASDQGTVTTLKNRLSVRVNKTVEITETGPSAVEGRIKFKLAVS